MVFFVHLCSSPGLKGEEKNLFLAYKHQQDIETITIQININ